MMDDIDLKDKCFDVDIEKGVVSDELGSSGGFIFGIIRMNGVRDCVGLNNGEDVNLVVIDEKVGKKMVREKGKQISAKKPPRPPRGVSLDLADRKLIRELREVAKLKRARIDRMKKKAKEAKASSSRNYQFATLITVLFCLVLLFQGISSRTSSDVNSHASVISSIATEGSVISVQGYPTSSAGNLNRPMSEPSRFEGPISGHDNPEQFRAEVG